jgi:N4-gp56 family major capsid protein
MIQSYGLVPQRLGKFKGAILAHAQPGEMLGKQGRQVSYPKNNSDTYVARRYLPYGATSTSASSQNQFFQNATGDRGNVIVQAHQTQEGVTPLPDSIAPVDITVVIQQYACLYGFTDRTYDLYEDDIPAQMTMQIGERVTFVNEMIIYGILRTCTNVYYGGAGTTIATVNGGPTLGLVRKIVKNLQANHAKVVNKMLGPGPNYGTQPVSEGYLVFVHTDLEPDVRDLPGYVPTELYANGKPMPGEIGKVERFRFIGHPDLPALQDAGAAIGATNLYSTTGTSIDVYTMIVVAENAWSQVAVRGKDSLKPTYLPPGAPSKSDVFGQRGYAGTIWYKAVMIENHGWMAVAYVGSKILS